MIIRKLLAASLLSLMCLSPIGFSILATHFKPLHYRICEDTSIPGKAKTGECFEYARHLSMELSRNGIHGRLVFYSWRLLGREIGSGKHVFVHYTLGDGSEWIVDNEHADPISVPSGSPLIELVYILGGTNKAVDVDLDNPLNKLSFF